MLVCACSSDRRTDTVPPDTGTPTATTTSVEPQVTASATPEPPNACGGLIERFDQTLGSGSGKCSTNADCACYPGGISKQHGCGGISDKATTDELLEIHKEFRAAKCTGPSCAAWSCQPICKSGLCANGP
jgi:hypothetical protein